MRAWGAEHCPHITDPEKATDEFVDYWRGVPGAKGLKLDWIATWRNRMRELEKRSAERLPAAHIPPGAVPHPGAEVIPIRGPRQSTTDMRVAAVAAAGEAAKRRIYGT
jgi:hypothetical protein